MIDFTPNELEAIISLVEDAYPILEIMKRRTGAGIGPARLVYAGIEAKAQEGLVAARKPVELKKVD